MSVIERPWIRSFFLVLLFFAVPAIWAAPLTWTNSGGGNWNVANNWSPNQVPGAADAALINSPGTYAVVVNSSVTVASLTVGGAAGAQTLQVNGATLTAVSAAISGTLTAMNSTLNGAITVQSGGMLNESGGTLPPSGSLTVAGGGVLNVAASTFTLQGPVTNAGTINLTNASFYLYNNNGVNWAGGINNQGVLNFYGASGDTISSYGAGYEYLINQGTVNEEAGTGLSTINVPVGSLAGTYNAALGTTVRFAGGSASYPLTVGTPPVLNGPGQYQFNSGYLMLTVDAIANLALTGGTLELGPGFQQSGAITNLTLNGIGLAAGSYQVSGTLTATNSTLNGSITVQSGGMLNESGGTLPPSGSLTVAGGGVLNVAASTFTLQGPVTNAGTINLTNASFYLYNNNGVNWAGGINNQGVLNFYGASGDTISSYGAGYEYLINQGTVNEEAGTGLSTINVPVGSLAGTYNAALGTTVRFAGGSASYPLTVGTPPVLNGPGQYQFNSGYLMLTVDAIANLALTGGTLELGPGFQQSGAITNLTLNGIGLAAGSYQVSGTLTATNSTLNGSITVQSGGMLNESGGTLPPSGSLTVAGGGVLNLAASTFTLQGPVTNAGTINLTNASFYLYNNNGVNWAGGINNQGVLNFYGASGDTISSYGAGYEYLINQGTVNEEAGTGLSTINVPVGSLAGTYNAALGTTVRFAGGSASYPLTVGTPPVLNGPGQYQFNSGYLMLTVDAIANLALTGGTLELGPGFQQSGAITNLTLNGIGLAAGSYQVSGTLTATNSTLNGSITVQSGGMLNESGGTLPPSGSLTVAGGGVLNVAASTFTLQGPVTNAGTINLTNASFYLYNNNGVNWAGGINNQGVLNFYGASGDTISSYGAGYEYLINQGTVNEEAGTGLSTINVPVGSLAGTYNAALGTTVRFAGGSASYPLTVGTPPVLNGPGQYQFNSGYLMLTVDAIANLALTGGTLELGPGFQQSGAITNLTLNGIGLAAGSYQVSGTLTATNSTLNGSITVQSGGMLNESGGTLPPSGSLTVAGGGVLNLAASTFTLQGPVTNAGTINLTNASFYLYNNNGVNWAGGINNQGVLNFYGASGDTISSYGAGYEYLINQGTVNEEAGTGPSSIQASFTNNGTVNVLTGILNFNGSFTTMGGTLGFGVSSLSSFGQIKILGNVALNGTASVTWLGGFLPAVGNSFALLNYGSHSGSFANINLPPGTLGNGNYSNTVFSLLITGTTTQTNSPFLKIERATTAAVVISWPTAAGNFTLQTRTNLSSGIWSDISNGITAAGSDYVLTNSVNGKAAFFRLRSQ